jgi:Arc/MetJ-type ribon-helix-helix transcriptional regulator
MSTKQRLSASVDAELLEAAERAVRRGQAPTVSAWVNEALRLRLEQQRRHDALAAYIATYEAEHGSIGPEEIRMATRRARSRALSVRAFARRKARGGRPTRRA